MKTFYAFLIVLIFCSQLTATEIDWTNIGKTFTQDKVWLLNNDSVALTRINYFDDKASFIKSELQFWDIATATLIKTQDLKEGDLPINIDFIGDLKEFYYKSGDTLIFRKLDDYSISRQIVFAPNTYTNMSLSWYDKINNNFIQTLLNGDSTTFLIISMKTNEIINKYNYNISSGYFKGVFPSDDGNRFTFTLNNNEISIVNCLTGELENKIFNVNTLWKTNISTSGRYLFVNYIIATDSIYFRVYDLLNNNQVFDPKKKIDLNQTCKFSKDEKRILVTGPYNNSYYYEIGNPLPLRTIENQNNTTYGYLCLNDKFYIDCGLTNILKRWNLDTDTPATVLSLIDVNGIHKNLKDIYYHDGRKKYYTVGSEGILTEHDIKDGKILNYFNITSSDLKILKSNLIDTVILSFSNKIQYFDLNQYKAVKEISMKFTNITKISNDLKWITGTALNQGTLLYNSELNKTVKLDSGRMYSYGIDFSSDSKYVAVGGTDHKLYVYDLSKVFTDETPLFSVQTQYKKPQDTTPYNDYGLLYIKFICNDSMIVTSSENFTNFKIWNAFTGDSIMQPVAKANQGLFTRIIYLEYRKEFDDYISLDDYGVIIYWTKNFEYIGTFTKLIDPVNTQGYWAFEYLPKQNKLLAGGLQNWISLLSLDGATEVENSDNISDGLLIYPNPAKDYIHIQPSEVWQPSEGSEIQIFDILGVIVLTVEQTSPSVQRIDISNLSPGMYFIKIGNRVEKFVKM